MLKVCILTETYHPVIGGGETQARLLAEGLVARGASVIVLTRRSDPALPRHERYGHVVVHRLWPPGRGQLKKWGLLLSAGPALLRLRSEYDIVFVSGFRIVGLAAVVMARILRKAVVLKADSRGEMSGAFFEAGLDRAKVPGFSLLFRAFLKLRNAALRRADAFVAITPEITAEYAAAGIPESRVRMVPNGVETSRFGPLDAQARAELRIKLGIDAAARVAVYTGRLVSYKGLPTLLRAWPEVLRAVPAARLLLLGEGGLDIHNCEQQLREQVQQEGLAGSVTFVGAVSDVSPWLQAADVFVFPTENDAFPSSLVEAMACGLAVVTTPVGAIPTIVQAGETGVLVTPADSGRLAEALVRVFRDPGLSSRLGAAARQAALGKYSAGAMTSRYLDLFRAVLRNPDGGAPRPAE